MDRRAFLQASVAGALGIGATFGTDAGRAAVSPAGPSEEDRASPPAAGSKVAGRLSTPFLQRSCAAYSFRKELSGDHPSLTLERFIDLCAEWGLDGTELTSYYFRQTDPEYLASLRRRATVNGLAVSGAPIRSDFCVSSAEKLEEELAHVRKWVDHASLLGAQTIRIFAGTVPRGENEETALRRAIENMKVAAEYAATKGVVLALENHGGVTETADRVIRLVEGVDSPWLGVNLDTGNFHEDVYASLERIAPYAVAVQVKTEVNERGKSKEDTDYDRVARILRNASYRGFVALEFEAAGDAMEEVPRHLELLGRALRGK